DLVARGVRQRVELVVVEVGHDGPRQVDVDQRVLNADVAAVVDFAADGAVTGGDGGAERNRGDQLEVAVSQRPLCAGVDRRGCVEVGIGLGDVQVVGVQRLP